MSELKVHKIGDLCFDFKMGKDVGIDFYLKSEADKVINHQKFKRCLDNAWRCRKLRNVYSLSAYNHRGWKIARYYNEKAELYRKWNTRWLKIAEQFKEAKR